MLHLFTCHGHIMPHLAELLLIEIHIFNDNSADPDQLASSETNCSGFRLFVKTGRV